MEYCHIHVRTHTFSLSLSCTLPRLPPSLLICMSFGGFAAAGRVWEVVKAVACAAVSASLKCLWTMRKDTGTHDNGFLSTRAPPFAAGGCMPGPYNACEIWGKACEPDCTAVSLLYYEGDIAMHYEERCITKKT